MGVFDITGIPYFGTVSNGAYYIIYKGDKYIARPEDKEKLDEFIKSKREQDERYSAEFRSKDRSIRK